MSGSGLVGGRLAARDGSDPGSDEGPNEKEQCAPVHNGESISSRWAMPPKWKIQVLKGRPMMANDLRTKTDKKTVLVGPAFEWNTRLYNREVFPLRHKYNLMLAHMVWLCAQQPRLHAR